MLLAGVVPGNYKTSQLQSALARGKVSLGRGLRAQSEGDITR